MTIINGYFDEIQLWDSAYFSKPVITDTEIIIPARNIEICEGHPLNNTDKPILLSEAKLIFGGVQKSERLIGEYLGEPKSGIGFKPSYKITDGPFVKTDEVVELFVVEGVLEEPPAWMTWEIQSVSFALEVSQAIEIKIPDIGSDSINYVSSID